MSIYPRISTDWRTVLTYTQNMKSGAVFPPIDVANVNGKIILIDGFHRLEASKKIGQTHIQANFLKISDMREAYEEALKRNLKHGRILSMYEKMLAFQRLLKEGYHIEKISGILEIPQGSLEKYASQRITISTTGKEVVLKAPFKHMSGKTDMEISEDGQRGINIFNQLHAIHQIITMIKNGWINKDNKEIKTALEELKGLL